MNAAPSSRERTAVVAIFVVALVLRVLVLLQYEERHPLADRPVIDELAYEEWGREIADGDWMGDEVFFQEPLYPYWIGTVYTILGEDRTALRLLQAGLGALTSVLVWALARRTFGTGPALVAGFAFAAYRPALLYPSLFLKPNLFLPVVAGTALVLLRAVERSRGEGRGALAGWFGVGLLAGLGALLRGNMLVLLPVLAASAFVMGWLRNERRPRRAPFGRAIVWCAAFLLGSASMLAPIALRNHYVGGVFALTTSGAGTNLYGGNNPENPYGIAKEFDWVRGIPEYEAQDWRHEAERRAGRELTPTEVSSFWTKEALRSMRERPLLHLSILWKKLRLALSSYEVPDNHHLEWDARFVPLLALPIPGFATWGWLSLAGMLAFLASPRLRGRDVRGPLTVASCFLAYLATIVLTVMSMRARIALLPLLLPFGGWLVCALPGLLRDRRSATTVISSLLFSGVVVFTPVFDQEAREEKLAARDFNLVTYLLRDGAPSHELLSRVEQLDTDYPRSLRVWSLRAEVEFRMAREAHAAGDAKRTAELLDASRQRLKIVVERSGSNERERHRAHLLGGEIAAFAGDARDAEACYGAALLFDPSDLHARRGHADALLVLAAGAPRGVDMTRVAEAIAEYRTVLADDAGDRSAALGLANALFLSAESLTGAERSEAITECERLLEELLATGMPVEELLERVRGTN